jgi:hypothetical protein
MELESKFWRLLGEYERLTRDETTALRELNFSLIREVQDKKREFLRELAEVGGQCGLNRKNPEVARRFTLLSEACQHNEALAKAFLAKRRGELDSVCRVSGQIRTFRAVYARGRSRSAGNFIARG